MSARLRAGLLCLGLALGCAAPEQVYLSCLQHDDPVQTFCKLSPAGA